MSYEKNHTIDGIPVETKECKVFHAGTISKDGRMVSHGGRVLGITATASTLSDAQKIAYDTVAKITWKDCFYRTDIGYKALLGSMA